MDEPNQAPEAGVPIIDPAAAAAAPAVSDPVASTVPPVADAQPPAADAPKRAPRQRKAATARPPGWYATEAFRTQYQGIMLSFAADQLIDDETMAAWLADTGSPVDYLEG